MRSCLSRGLDDVENGVWGGASGADGMGAGAARDTAKALQGLGLVAGGATFGLAAEAALVDVAVPDAWVGPIADPSPLKGGMLWTPPVFQTAGRGLLVSEVCYSRMSVGR